jgi:hypothetical protein
VGLRRRGIVIRGAAAAVCFASLCERARCAARVLLLVKQVAVCRAGARQRIAKQRLPVIDGDVTRLSTGRIDSFRTLRARLFQQGEHSNLH